MVDIFSLQQRILCVREIIRKSQEILWRLWRFYHMGLSSEWLLYAYKINFKSN